MLRHLVSIVPAQPGSRVVYRDEESEFGYFIEPLVLWAHYRELHDGRGEPLDMIYGLASSSEGVTETDATNVIGYLAPGEQLDQPWWERHGGAPDRARE